MFSALSYYELGRLMQEFLPHVLVNHGFTLHTAVDADEGPRVTTVQVRPGEPIQVPDQHNYEPLSPERRANWKPILQAIREQVVGLRFKASHDTVARMLAELDASDYVVRGLADDAIELHGRLVAELKYTTCFALVGADEDLYREPNQFGDAVAIRFSDAVYDIDEAAKCLALDRGTACVFHLMRVLEIALQVLGRDLQLAKIDQNWEVLLNEVDAAIRALPFKADAEKAYRAPRSEAAAHLRNVKNAWRNKTAHPGNKYTPEEAANVWVHSKALMQSLATFL